MEAFWAQIFNHSVIEIAFSILDLFIPVCMNLGFLPVQRRPASMYIYKQTKSWILKIAGHVQLGVRAERDNSCTTHGTIKLRLYYSIGTLGVILPIPIPAGAAHLPDPYISMYNNNQQIPPITGAGTPINYMVIIDGFVYRNGSNYLTAQQSVSS